MQIYFTHRAARQLEALLRSAQARIAKKMRFYARQEDPLRFAKRLADSRDGEYRFRIGDYRVTFDVKDGTIYVLKVGRRDKVYD